jgi:hypothetical protein
MLAGCFLSLALSLIPAFPAKRTRVDTFTLPVFIRYQKTADRRLRQP